MRNAISGMWESLQEALGPHFDNRTFQALSLLGKYFGATNPPNVAYNAVGSEIVERKRINSSQSLELVSKPFSGHIESMS